MRIRWLNLLVLPFATAAYQAAENTAAPHVHYAAPPEFSAAAPSGALAPRLQNLGAHAFNVSHAGEQGQRFMNQGMNLAYGFNHAEARRSFAEAARLDPNNAMAFWGQALVLGPNINVAMDPSDEPDAHALVQHAVQLAPNASPRERDYIAALSKRYTNNATDRITNDQAYAQAMAALATKYPDDLDAKTLYAEALMDLRPWNYWMKDGEANSGTREIVNTLSDVIDRNPNHPGALHLWIHLWEPTKTPERAEAEADRLLPLVPGAGHLVHMPGHIYLRVGRYADMIRVNQQAVLADEDYIAQCRAQGLYPLAYYPHNLHFVWMGATMTGQSALALQAASKAASAIPIEALKQAPVVQGFLVVPYFAQIRFGKWNELLANPKPAHDTLFTRAIWHYGRGFAHARLGKLELAQQDLAALEKISADPALANEPTFTYSTTNGIVRIAPQILAGEIAAAQRDYDRALAHLERAVRFEDALNYNEPPDWPIPVRHHLGAVLLQADRPDEAEAVYWEDLRRNPHNGWSLFGLWQSLTAQRRFDEANVIRSRFDKAWRDADTKLTASRF